MCVSFKANASRGILTIVTTNPAARSRTMNRFLMDKEISLFTIVIVLVNVHQLLHRCTLAMVILDYIFTELSAFIVLSG